METILQEIKNEINEMRKQMATKDDITKIKENISNIKKDMKGMATKEDLLDLATKTDVANIPLITSQEDSKVEETVGEMKIDIEKLKENDIRLEEMLLHQRKLIDLLTIKTTDHEVQLKWDR